MKHPIPNRILSSCLAMAFSVVPALCGGAAEANIIDPGSVSAGNHALPSSIAMDEAHEILDRASLIVFESASTVQKLQTLSVDNATSEMLKNYMASMIYIPRSMKLPSDAEAMDEPWLASASGIMGEGMEGMVSPHLDDDDTEPVDAKGMELDTPNNPARTFLKLLKPVQNGLVTSPFGFRWGRPHQGIDMAAPVGTPINSAEGGKVVFSGWKQGYGNFISISHGHGYETHYAHCSKVLVRVGQAVKKGQMIARVGNTGNSTGPHLHFEVVAHGIHRNPVKFINHTLTVVQAR